MGRSPFDGSQSADQMGFWDLGDFTWRKKIISVLLVLFLFLPVSDTILLFLACQSSLWTWNCLRFWIALRKPRTLRNFRNNGCQSVVFIRWLSAFERDLIRQPEMRLSNGFIYFTMVFTERGRNCPCRWRGPYLPNSCSGSDVSSGIPDFLAWLRPCLFSTWGSSTPLIATVNHDDDVLGQHGRRCINIDRAHLSGISGAPATVRPGVPIRIFYFRKNKQKGSRVCRGYATFLSRR